MGKENDRGKLLIQQFLLIVWSFLFVKNLTAQTEVIINQTTTYDQNIFRNYSEIDGWINQSHLYLAHNVDFTNARFRFDYAGDLSLFHDYPDRLFHTHQLGLLSLLPLNQNLQLNLGGNFQIRENKSEYNIYDYSNWALHSHFQYEKRQNTVIQIGYRFRDRLYTNLAELSYREHFGFLRIKHFFPTKTTFIGEINVGAKKYTDHLTIEELVITTGSGTGRGKGHQHGNGTGGITDTSIAAYNMTAPKAHQWTIKFKLAQSVSASTGLSLEYVRRFKPAEDTRYLRGQEYSYTKEDELFDDPYTYGSHEWQFVLTKLLPWSCRAKFYANLLDKEYLYRAEDYFSDGDSLFLDYRIDRQSMVGLNLSRRFTFDWIFQNITVYFSYYYLKNKSNDLYFDFEGNLVNTGIEVVY